MLQENIHLVVRQSTRRHRVEQQCTAHTRTPAARPMPTFSSMGASSKPYPLLLLAASQPNSSDWLRLKVELLESSIGWKPMKSAHAKRSLSTKSLWLSPGAGPARAEWCHVPKTGLLPRIRLAPCLLQPPCLLSPLASM